ncbi:MAG: hypothetical protein VB877_16640, partial [Pirellulaceae bacterium]
NAWLTRENTLEAGIITRPPAMPKSKTQGSDKELKEGRQQRHALLFIWASLARSGSLLSCTASTS